MSFDGPDSYGAGGVSGPSGISEQGGEVRGRSTGPRDRIPPHDILAEKAVLSAILLDNSAIYEITGELRPDDFYVPAHRRLYAAMESLKDANQP